MGLSLNPGGGGSRINGIVESYKALAGENISAGDFVKYVVDLSSSQVSTLVSSINTGLTSSMSAILLHSGDILVVFSVNGKPSGIVVHINGTFIEPGPIVELSTSLLVYSRFTLALLPNGDVFFPCLFNGDVNGVVVRVNGSSISVVSSAPLVASDMGIQSQSLAITLHNGNVFVTYTTSYTPLNCMVVSVVDGNITRISAKILSTKPNSGAHCSVDILPCGDVFVAHTIETYMYLSAMVVSINGTEIDPGTDVQLLTLPNSGYQFNAVTLPSGNVYIAYGYNYTLRSISVEVINKEITLKTDRTLTNLDNASNSAMVLPGGDVLIMHGGYADSNMMCTITSTYGISQTLKGLTYDGSGLVALMLSDRRIFVVYCIKVGSSYNRYGFVLNKSGVCTANNGDEGVFGISKSKAKNDGNIDIIVPNVRGGNYEISYIG